MTKKQVEGKDFEYVRSGRCQPKKCGSFCCRHGFMIRTNKEYGDMSYNHDYGLITLGEDKEDIIFGPAIICKSLEGSRCGNYSKRSRTCRDFPSGHDQLYYLMAKKHGCTYNFKRVPIKKKKVKL